MNYPDLFKKRYPVLRGSDWIRRIDQDDRKAFARIGFEASDYGRSGGRARAIKAQRDKRGRFVKNDKENKHQG